MSTEVTTTEMMSVSIARLEGRKFLGYTIDEFGGEECPHLPEMKYHTSWAWIMPVVEKIGSLTLKSRARYNPDIRFRIEIVNGYTKIEGTGIVINVNSSIEGSMLMATFKAVYQFSKWYNQQKQTNDERGTNKG